MSLQQGHINEVLSAGIADVKEDKIAIAVFVCRKWVSLSLVLSLSLSPSFLMAAMVTDMGKNFCLSLETPAWDTGW